MFSQTKDVHDFHVAFNHPVLPEPAIPSADRIKLRINLLREELDELEKAANEGNIVEVADAICDLEYVLHGAALEFGLHSKFPALFEELQRSNLSKACQSEEEAIQTQKHWEEKEGKECGYYQFNGLYLVYRKDDKKTMKSVNYSPADFKSVLEK